MRDFLNRLAIVTPIMFVLGASMEMFMIKTGFYTIVTRKEAERRVLSDHEKLGKLKALQESLKNKADGSLSADYSNGTRPVK